MYTLKYDKKIKEFRHRDSCLVRIRKEKSMAFKECKYYVIHDYYPLSGIGNDVDNKNITPYLTINSEQYKGKNVLLFDDVITSGSSFKQVSAKLLETGAKSVTGIFLSKTTRE